MIRGVARTASQRLGSRAALGVSSSTYMRTARRNFVAFSRLCEYNPFSSSSLSSRRPLLVSTLASMPVVAHTAGEEKIDALSSTPVLEQLSAVAANPEAVRTFSDIASSHYLPVRALMHVLDSLHSAGLTWAGAIVLVTFSLRVILVPFLIYSSRVGVKMAQMRPEMEELSAEFNRRKALNVDARENSVLQSQGLMNLYKKHGVSPMSAMVMPMVSMPIFVSCFFALTAMCTEGVPGMSTEGALWFQDLTAKDPYFILPILSSWTGVLVLKRGSESGGVIDPKVQPMLKAFTALGFVAPVLTYQLPSGVLLYFTTMSVVSLLQGEIIRADATRRVMGIPTLSEMRILKQVGEYTPFQAAGPSGAASAGSKGASDKTTEEDANKKTVRKKPLPMPSRKR